MDNSNVNFLKDDNKSKSLIYKSVIRNFPILVLSGTLTLLIQFVDSIVVARYLGESALNGVNVIAPFVTIIGATIGMCSRGISVIYAKALASDNVNKDKYVIKASVILTLALMIVISLIEYPLARLMISRYALDEVTRDMAWQYTQQMMVALVVGVISTIGSAYLNALGKAKLMFGLAVMEGVVNLILDVLFVGYTSLGVAGAGYATVCANTLRAVITAVALQKSMKIFPLVKGIDFAVFRDIFKNGIYLFIKSMCFALQGYIINWLILKYTGEEGYTAFSVAAFTVNLGSMIICSMTEAIQPVMGIFSQIRFYSVAQKITRDTLKIVITCSVLMAMISYMNPHLLFSVYKISEYSQMQVEIVRLRMIYMIFYCINDFIRTIMNNWEMKKAASILAMTEYIFLLIPMCVIVQALSAQYGLFIAYIITSLIIMCVTIVIFNTKFSELKRKDVGLADWNLTLNPSQAVQASEEASQFLEKLNLPNSVSFKISLLIEEFVAHVKKRDKEIAINLYIRVFPNKVTFFAVNNGADESRIDDIIQDEVSIPMANNYYLIKEVSDEYAFRRICDLNTYSTCIYY